MAVVLESDNVVGAGPVGSRAASARALLARHALALTLLLALAVRLVLIARAPAILDGDEALVGIQAESIAAGATHPLPVFFYSQSYMGALEAYLAAGVFRLVGPSVLALRAVPLAFALLLVLLTYELARRVVGRQAARVAALLAAVAPLYPAVWSLKARGGYVETLALGSALLIVTHRLLYDPGDGLGLAATERAARPRGGPGRMSLRPYLGRIAKQPLIYLLWGLLAGLLFWVNPVSLYYIVTGAGALAVGALRRHGWRAWRPDARGRLARAALPALAPIVVGVVAGGLPLWVDNFYTRGATFAYLLAPSDGGVAGAIRRAPHVAAFLSNNIAPKLTGAWEPWGAPTARPLGAVVLALYALSAAYLLLRLAAGRRGVLGYRARPRHGQGLLISFALVVAAVFCLSSFGGEALNTLGFDAASRYALPLVSVLPIAAGALVWRLWRAWVPLGAAALAVLLLVNLLGYATARPNEVFQSEYWAKLPLGREQTQLARFLADNNIRSVWMNHWAGYPLMFEADAYAPGRLAAADYNDVVLHGGVNRLPWALTQAEGDPRAAFVLVTGQAHPPLEKLFQAQKITFRPERIGPYLVYYDLSRPLPMRAVKDELGFMY